LALAVAMSAATLSAGETAPQKPGVVSFVKVVSDKVPDVSSLDAWKKSYIRDNMSDEEKALAVWKTVWTFQHQDEPPAEYFHQEGIVQDAIKIFNVYGYSFCGVATADTQALARHVGLKARGHTIVNHVVSEIFHDNGWRLLDASLICYFPKADGKPASVQEIVDGVSGWLAKNPGLKGDNAKLGAYMKAPGWKNGPEVLLKCPTYSESGWLPALTHGWYSQIQEYDGTNRFDWEPGYSLGYQVNIQLRPGEKIVRNWSNKGLHVNMSMAGAPYSLTGKIGQGTMQYCAKDGDLAPGRIGNGTHEYRVPLASRHFHTGALSASNIASRADDQQPSAVHVKDPAQPGEFTVRMPSSYVYLGGNLSYTAVVGGGGEVSVQFSDNNGESWKEISKATANGEQKVDLKTLNFRRYDYRLKFTLKGKGTGLDALTITNDIQHSQRPLPALDKGENKLAFSAGSAEGTITLEGSTNPAHKDKQVTYLDYKPKVNSLAETDLLVNGEKGDITFTVNTPGDMTRLRFGTHYRAREAKRGWDYEASFDGGKTFKTVDRAAGPTARDVKYTTVNDVPAGTRSAQVRFSGTSAGSATMIFGFRIDADYKEPHGGFAPVKVTYEYEEDGKPKTETRVMKSPNEAFTINCASRPLMKSITLELAE